MKASMPWVIRSWTWLTWVAVSILGVNDDDLDAQLAGIAFNAELDLVEEVRLQIGDGQPDLFDSDTLCGWRYRPPQPLRLAASNWLQLEFHGYFLLGCVVRVKLVGTGLRPKSRTVCSREQDSKRPLA